MRRCGGPKWAMGERSPIEKHMAPNQRWSIDLISDQLTDGRRFRIVMVLDDRTRECLQLWPTPRSRAAGWIGNWI
jgi:putative transposase